MKSRKVAIGLDFGTESARAAAADLESGTCLGQVTAPFRHGVLEQRLPGSSRALKPDTALQDADDYLRALRTLIPKLLRRSGISPQSVVGIGADFTACTVLPTLEDGTPLSRLRPFRPRPHGWTKLWKHHAAQPDADRVNLLAKNMSAPFLKRCGGKVSSEWLLPKFLEVLREDPAAARAAALWVEAQDWLVWQLTGSLRRSACAAGYKGLWSKSAGGPGENFLNRLEPGLGRMWREKVGGEFHPPGNRAGGLSADWARVLGLLPGTPVGVPIIDAHSAVLGCGVSGAGQMLICLGTSTCHLLLARREKPVEGICGVVEDGIVPGFFGYEAGQAATGDIFLWFVRRILGGKGDSEPRIFRSLEREAAALPPGSGGLLALDWWNGNRSVLVNADLSGLLIGMTLRTRPAEIYRALIEATAFGTLKIIRAFERESIPIRELVASGGIAERNPLLLQIYADVTGRRIRVPDQSQACAWGAAVLGAAAGGAFPSVRQAVSGLSPRTARRVHPNPRSHSVYRKMFRIYERLHDQFGRDSSLMKELKSLRSHPRS